MRRAGGDRRWPAGPRRVLSALLGLAVLAVLLAPLTLAGGTEAGGLPRLVDESQLRGLTTILLFVVLASSWNIIGGLTGYASFGNVVFFGLGAYTTGFLVDAEHGHLPFPLALLAAPVVPALFAALMGVPLLRLRGHYFAIATLGTSIAVGEIINNLDVLGGSAGLYPPILHVSDVVFFYLMAANAALAVGATWWIRRSRFGYGLIAIRENEEAAAAIGVNTTRYKVAAFVLAAALTGIAGGIFAQWNSFINHENVFPIEYNVEMILMAVGGGAGTIFGPVVGAVLLEALIQAFAGGGDIAVFAQIGLGVLLAVVVIFLPRGVIDFFGGESRLSLRSVRQNLRETGV